MSARARGCRRRRTARPRSRRSRAPRASRPGRRGSGRSCQTPPLASADSPVTSTFRENGYHVEPSTEDACPGRAEQGHAMLRVGIEVDARDVARGAGLVALEQEVRAVLVVGIGAGQALDHEVSVLVGLGLRGLRHRSRERHGRAVVVVAVPRDEAGRVLDRVRSLDDRRPPSAPAAARWAAAIPVAFVCGLGTGVQFGDDASTTALAARVAAVSATAPTATRLREIRIR